MGRFTVEGCRNVVPNRFDLVILASQRARDLCAGTQPLLDGGGNRNIITALREISDNLLNIDDLKRLVIRRHKLNVVDFGYAPEPTNVETEKSGDNKQFNAVENEIGDIFFGDDDVVSQN